MLRAAAEIARAGGVCHGSTFRTVRRAGSHAPAGIADQRVRGLLIKPRRPLEIHILRRKDQEQQRYPTQYEMVLQTYVMPLGDFVALVRTATRPPLFRTA